MNLLKTMFCGLKTGSMRRLPYLGYSVFLYVLLLVLACIFFFVGIAALAYLDLNMVAIVIGVGLYVIVSSASLYASIVLTIKRIRNIGFQKPISTFILLVASAVLMVMLIEYLELAGLAILYWAMNGLYMIFYVAVQLFLFLAPEGCIGKSKLNKMMTA